jgi:hypothetical protein
MTDSGLHPNGTRSRWFTWAVPWSRCQPEGPFPMWCSRNSQRFVQCLRSWVIGDLANDSRHIVAAPSRKARGFPQARGCGLCPAISFSLVLSAPWRETHKADQLHVLWALCAPRPRVCSSRIVCDSLAWISTHTRTARRPCSYYTGEVVTC